jgi:hypothetical protein
MHREPLAPSRPLPPHVAGPTCRALYAVFLEGIPATVLKRGKPPAEVELGQFTVSDREGHSIDLQVSCNCVYTATTGYDGRNKRQKTLFMHLRVAGMSTLPKGANAVSLRVQFFSPEAAICNPVTLPLVSLPPLVCIASDLAASQHGGPSLFGLGADARGIGLIDWPYRTVVVVIEAVLLRWTNGVINNAATIATAPATPLSYSPSTAANAAGAVIIPDVYSAAQ